MQRSVVVVLVVTALGVAGALAWNSFRSATVGDIGPQITITEPAGFTRIQNPVHVSGTVSGEDAVEVRVVDHNGAIRATTTLAVTGGMFSGEIWYRFPETPLGAVVVRAGGSEARAAVTFPEERQAVRIFFSPQTVSAGEDPCTALVARERVVVGNALEGALEELVRGPYDAERSTDTSQIPAGTKLLSIDEQTDHVRILFSAELDRGVAGSCRVGSIRRQITATVTERSGPKEIIIAIEGKPDEEVLQP